MKKKKKFNLSFYFFFFNRFRFFKLSLVFNILLKFSKYLIYVQCLIKPQIKNVIGIYPAFFHHYNQTKIKL